MEQWIGSVHSKMAWQTHFFLFGVYRVLEKSSSYAFLFLKVTVAAGFYESQRSTLSAKNLLYCAIEEKKYFSLGW